MFQEQTAQWFPRETTSTSLFVTFRQRTTEGTGAFAAHASIPFLTVVYPNGNQDGVPVSQITDAILQHIENNLDQTSWSPKIGSKRDLLRKAVGSVDFTNLPSPGTSANVRLFFDGQFGSVYAA